ncbi:MAG: gamma-glutamylcyclotransferase [Pirellula sp.]|nr:gamma-glutamylcyclotransferase [Pirellula sp.]
MEAWYFAYGSNLLGSQLAARIGSAVGGGGQPPRRARLADHRLVFQHPKRERPAFANIVPGGEGVLGVVYCFTPADFQLLDRYEAGYERRTILVQSTDGEQLPAETYIMRAEDTGAFGRPDADYLQRILDGAKRHGLPEEYLASIVAVAAG